jgi:hypothetical protein
MFDLSFDPRDDLTQSSGHAAASNVDRPAGDFQVLSDSLDRLIFDHGSPEGLPSTFAKFISNLAGRPLKDVQLVFPFPPLVRFPMVGKGLKHIAHLRIAASATMLLVSPQEFSDLIPGYCQQPTAESPALRVVPKSRRYADQVPHGFLRDVGGVGILQSLPQGVRVQQRHIDIHELGPRRSVLRITDAEQ